MAFGDNPPQKECKTRYYRQEVHVGIGEYEYHEEFIDHYEIFTFNNDGTCVYEWNIYFQDRNEKGTPYNANANDISPHGVQP